MNGNDIYEAQTERRIKGLCSKNPDKAYLKSFADYTSIKNSKRTTYFYLTIIISFMNENGKDIKDLRLSDYTSYLAGVRDKTSSYQISVYAALKKFSKFLYANGDCNKNVMDNVERPRFTETIQTREKREKGYLTGKEIQIYLERVRKGVGSHRAIARQSHMMERDYLIIQMFLNTGMRCSALYKINYNDLKVNGDTVTLSIIDKENKINTYELNQNVVEAYILWMFNRMKYAKEDPALFINSRGTRISQTAIYEIVKKYSVDIKGKHISPHKLRATYGTQLYNKTKDIYLVQEAMNHSDPKTTELYIRGTKKESRRIAASVMAKLTGG